MANENENANSPVRVENPSANFWKPQKSGKGAAALFEFNPKNKSIFLTFMPQKANDTNGKFDSDKKISAKLGLNDIGEILAVLLGRQDGIGKKNNDGYWSGLYHQNSTGNAVISVSYLPAEGEYLPGYMVSLSVDKNGNKSRLSVKLSIGEATQLELFLRRYVVELF